MTQAVISQVISELQSLPQVQSYQVQTANNTAAMAAQIGQLVDLTAAQSAHIQSLLAVTAEAARKSIDMQEGIRNNTAASAAAVTLAAAAAPVYS